MAVIAARHAVGLEQSQDLRADIAPVTRRVVQEAVFFLLSRQLQRPLQPPELAPEDLLVVAAGLLFVIEPAARAAERKLPIKEAAVVQHVKIRKAVLRAEAVKGLERRPPVVVVALEDDLAAGDGVHEGKILRRVLQTHCPAEIAEQHGRILRPDDAQVLPELVDIALPPAAEDVHRLIGRPQRQVQIADRVQGHYCRNSVTTDCIAVLSATSPKRGVLPARLASGSGASRPVTAVSWPRTFVPG